MVVVTSFEARPAPQDRAFFVRRNHRSAAQGCLWRHLQAKRINAVFTSMRATANAASHPVCQVPIFATLKSQITAPIDYFRLKESHLDHIGANSLGLFAPDDACQATATTLTRVGTATKSIVAGSPSAMFLNGFCSGHAKCKQSLGAACHAWLKGAKSNTAEAERQSELTLPCHVDNAGRFGDFPSLRHTFISNFTGCSVHLKVAQQLAQHSTITLTMGRYSHFGLIDMTAELSVLPKIMPPGRSTKPSDFGDGSNSDQRLIQLR